MFIGHLEISSWRGISIGAVHWYAELVINDETEPYHTKRIKLKRPISSQEAKTMNKEAQARGLLSNRYTKGYITEGFNTEEDAVALGIQVFKDDYDGVLFLGDHCSYSAWKNAIYWPEAFTPLVKELNCIADSFQALNGYEGKQRKKVETLDKQFMRRYDAIKELIDNTRKPCSPESKTKKST